MSARSTAPPRLLESKDRSVAPEALTVEPVGHGVYRYSAAPSSTWKAEDLGRILGAIVSSEQRKSGEADG